MKDKKKDKIQNLLKTIRQGIRLLTPSPKTIVPKTAYKRNPKHKKEYQEE